MSTDPRLIAGLAAILLCLPLTLAEEPAKPHSPAQTFEPLFKPDLSNATFPAGVWSMDKEGVLNATKDEIIWSTADYEDFVLRFEFKNEVETNSGVFLHASNLKDWITDSVEIQLADDYAEKWASKPGSWQCGAMFGHQAAYIHAVKPAGEWNQMTIICSGPMITVHLNCVRVNTIDMRQFTSAVVNPDGSTPPPWQTKPVASLPFKGKIGFQGKHGNAPIYLRKVEVMRL